MYLYSQVPLNVHGYVSITYEGVALSTWACKLGTLVCIFRIGHTDVCLITYGRVSIPNSILLWLQLTRGEFSPKTHGHVS